MKVRYSIGYGSEGERYTVGSEDIENLCQVWYNGKWRKVLVIFPFGRVSLTAAHFAAFFDQKRVF